MTNTTDLGGIKLPEKYTISDIERGAKEYAANIPGMEKVYFEFRIETSLAERLNGGTGIRHTYQLYAVFGFQKMGAWYDRMCSTEGITNVIVEFDTKRVCLSWIKESSDKILKGFYDLCSIVEE